MAINLYVESFGQFIRTNKINNTEVKKIKLNGVEYNLIPDNLYCRIGGLGGINPTNTRFYDNTIKDWTPDIITINVGGVDTQFVQFPKFYRKVTYMTGLGFSSVEISTKKLDNDYKVYPCFLKEDGITEMDYILVAVNSLASTQTLKDERTAARNKGVGFQLYDWMIHKLIQDLAVCKLETQNTNDGTGISTLLELNVADTEEAAQNEWIDGIICSKTENNIRWSVSYKPSEYSSLSALSSDIPNTYTTLFTLSTFASGNITNLTYDITHPFANFPSSSSGSQIYTQYYCDRVNLSQSTGNYPVSTNIGRAASSYGVFYTNATWLWSNITNKKVRLCYRPINE